MTVLFWFQRLETQKQNQNNQMIWISNNTKLESHADLSCNLNVTRMIKSLVYVRDIQIRSMTSIVSIDCLNLCIFSDTVHQSCMKFTIKIFCIEKKIQEKYSYHFHTYVLNTIDVKYNLWMEIEMIWTLHYWNKEQ